MTFGSIAFALFLGAPAVVVASYPLHAWLLRRRSRRFEPSARPPGLSVIIPVRGLDEGRAAAQASLLEQQVGGAIEWLYCVEDETDPAVAELRQVAARDPARIRVLITGPCGERLGKLHNLMQGIAAASGEWLVFVDSDTILPHRHYLREFTAGLADPAVGLITCYPSYRRASSLPGALLTGAINQDLLGLFALESAWGGLRLANGSCLAIRAEALRRIGGFGPQSGCLLMDVILAQRVRQAGLSVIAHRDPVEVPCRRVGWQVWWNQSHRWQVGMSRVLSGPFLLWYCWMRTAFPLAFLLTFLAATPLAQIAALATVARFGSAVVMGQLFLGDRHQLFYVWLLPLTDLLTGFGCWYALLVNRVEWRGRRYRVLTGGMTRRLA